MIRPYPITPADNRRLRTMATDNRISDRYQKILTTSITILAFIVAAGSLRSQELGQDSAVAPQTIPLGAHQMFLQQKPAAWRWRR